MPSFYKEEKEKKMYFEWALRLGLENVKKRHALIGTACGFDKETNAMF